MQYPRNARQPIGGEVIIKRPGKSALKAREGNVSDGGLFVKLPQHDLQKGKRVEVILVSESGTVRDIQRMSGIVIRIESEGVALVTYKAAQLRMKDKDLGSDSNLTATTTETP